MCGGLMTGEAADRIALGQHPAPRFAAGDQQNADRAGIVGFIRKGGNLSDGNILLAQP
jgi:hypothetical protein